VTAIIELRGVFVPSCGRPVQRQGFLEFSSKEAAKYRLVSSSNCSRGILLPILRISANSRAR
jgi:hypothetical protein